MRRPPLIQIVLALMLTGMIALLPLHGAGTQADTSAAKWQAAVKRIGGEKLDFSAIETSGMLITVFGDQETGVRHTISYQLPDRIRTTLEMAGGFEVIVNSDTGVIKMGEQKMPMGTGAVQTQLEELKRSFFSLIQNHDDPDLQVKSIDGPSEERTCTWLELSIAGVQTHLCISESGEIIKQFHKGRHPLQQTPGELGFGYSDYREVEGRWIPHRWEVTFDGSLIYRIEIEKITFTPTFDDQTFRVEE